MGLGNIVRRHGRLGSHECERTRQEEMAETYMIFASFAVQPRDIALGISRHVRCSHSYVL